MSMGLLALLDDIALLADDIAITAKMATKKTAAILGDDLAVNAQKATGFSQDRELKVVWAITKGSLLNKIMILPVAFLLNYFASWLINIVLICGGIYLLYEGIEKVHEVLFHKKDEGHVKQIQNSTSQNILELEKKKIKSAVFTDFILSIEIVVIALSSVGDKPLMVQVFATSFVAFVATVGVYGLVAGIIRLDNIGFWLIDKGHEKLGQSFVSFMPKLISFLSFIGTIAMFMVGGGIIVHNIHFFHNFFISFLPDLANETLIGFVLSLGVFAIKIFIDKIFLANLNKKS